MDPHTHLLLTIGYTLQGIALPNGALDDAVAAVKAAHAATQKPTANPGADVGAGLKPAPTKAAGDAPGATDAGAAAPQK